ncbi:TPA: glycosyltransferase family 4 protein [Vibrio parahaemolyticus]
MKKVLLDASNLHHGGGVQVAASLIYEIGKLNPCDFQIIVVASKRVHNSLPDDFDETVFLDYSIQNRFGLGKNSSTISKLSKRCDVSLTVFGPQYSKLKSKIKVTGFAQPWIAYPENDMYDTMSFFNALKTKMKFFIQRKFFFRDDILIVEHSSVSKALKKNYKKPPKIRVIENTVSAPFIDRSLRKVADIPMMNNKFVIGFLGKNYPHKNLGVFKEVDAIIRNKYKLDIGFLFSLDNDEMIDLGFDAYSNFYSCGTITNPQCPSFYEAIDLFVFPTLLECFSAAPLEAMVSKVDVLASERDFIKDVYGENVIYFDPLNPNDIADKIYNHIHGEKIEKKKLNLNYNASTRALAYCDLIRELI